MTVRTTSDEAITLLATLHDLSRATLPIDLGILAGRLGWGVGRVVRVLEHLDRKGLADRRRYRLTLAGLALAAVLATRATASAA